MIHISDIDAWLSLRSTLWSAVMRTHGSDGERTLIASRFIITTHTFSLSRSHSLTIFFSPPPPSPTTFSEGSYRMVCRSVGRT